MKPVRLAGGVALAALLAVGVWQGLVHLDEGRAASPPANTASPAATPAPTPSEVSEVASATIAGETPMPQRVAVIGFLNKRNGNARDLTLKPGQAVRIGDAVVRLRACEKTAPWEQDQLTGAFLQLDVQGTDKKWRRSFSGWLFAERPALNVVQNQIYDVWPKSCTMSFPATGPNTVTLSGDGDGRRSSARKSPSTTGEPETSPATDAPSAAPSNAL